MTLMYKRWRSSIEVRMEFWKVEHADIAVLALDHMYLQQLREAVEAVREWFPQNIG